MGKKNRGDSKLSHQEEVAARSCRLDSWGCPGAGSPPLCPRFGAQGGGPPLGGEGVIMRIVNGRKSQNLDI